MSASEKRTLGALKLRTARADERECMCHKWDIHVPSHLLRRFWAPALPFTYAAPLRAVLPPNARVETIRSKRVKHSWDAHSARYDDRVGITGLAHSEC